MDPRLYLLTIPSFLALLLAVAHSRRALAPRRAAVFWVACVGYGVVRGVAVRWITETRFGGAMPYAIDQPLFTVAGVSLQEVAGWAVVGYLGWWVGSRLAGDDADGPSLFAQVGWAMLFLGSIAWAVEATAIAAGWWSWRVPVTSALPGGVPPIGLVDWSFVALDFLLPAIALTAPSLRSASWRYATLLLFPLHFAGHLLTERVIPGVPIPGLHLVHWALAAGLLWAILRGTLRDRAFTQDRPWLAGGALAIVLGDLVLVQLFWIGRAELLVTLVPATLLALGAWFRPSVVRIRRVPVPFAFVLIGVVAALAWAVHARAAHEERELLGRLDAALELRDSGGHEEAVEALLAINRTRPVSHAAAGFAGEILYRLGRIDDARESFEQALSIKDDFAMARRFLAVIALRQGRADEALRIAARGAALEPADPELRYLERRAAELVGAATSNDDRALDQPQTALGLAALAFEVDDRVGAEQILDAAIARWPNERALHDRRLRLALAGQDRLAALAVLRRWLQHVPGDPLALEHARAIDGLTPEGHVKTR